VQYIFSVKDAGLRTCTLSIPGAAGVPERDLVEAVRAYIGIDYSRFSFTSLAHGTLLQKYRQQGYWRAAFHEPVATLGSTSSCSGVAVTIAVDEGDPYGWDHAEWVGVSAIPPKDLDGLLGMKAGEPAGVSRIEAGLLVVTSAYAKQGYLLESATFTPTLDDAAKRAVFRMSVNEGAQFRMGTLEVVGFPEADAAKLKSKWRLKPGDVYDGSYLSEFLRVEVLPLRRPAAPEQRLDQAARTVNVRIVAK
jgi:outer membrane protein insertion porin family